MNPVYLRKLLLSGMLAVFLISTASGQSFDWNIHGGLNLMKAKSGDSNMAMLYHAGIQAGVRITNIGVYGEIDYSLHEDQYGGDPIPYLIPAALVKAYTLRFIFIEAGAAYLAKMGDSDVDPDIMNPDEKIFLLAGMGVHVSKLEFSIRTEAKQSYGVIRFTAALKF